MTLAIRRGDRIIRIRQSQLNIKVGDKVIAGKVEEDGRFVYVNGKCYRTCFFKRLIRCNPQG